MNKDVIISTLTNLAYGLAGLAQYLMFPKLELIVPSIWLGVLMLGSGYHHYHMKAWSRKWDYIGMYGALTSSISFGIWASSFATWLFPVLLTVLLFFLFESSPKVVAVLVAILLTIVSIVGHPIYGMGLIFVSCTPLVFRTLGDTVLKDRHDFIHGIGWHIPTAGALMTANVILGLAHFKSLPLL